MIEKGLKILQINYKNQVCLHGDLICKLSDSFSLQKGALAKILKILGDTGKS